MVRVGECHTLVVGRGETSHTLVVEAKAEEGKEWVNVPR